MKLTFTDTHGNKSEVAPLLGKDTWVLSLDGSTSRSGICLMSIGGLLGFVCAAARGQESVVEYKLALKKVLSDMVAKYGVRHTAYEEPFIGYAGDAKGLYMIASTLEEIAVESMNSIRVSAVNNKRWKRQFLGVTLQGGREVQKKMVYNKAVSIVPGLVSCKDDETDAFGLAFYLARSLREDTFGDMASKGKAHKFKYDLTLVGGIIGADAAVRIVGKPRKDGVIVADISDKRSFNSTVYAMMAGKDSVLLLRFKSGKFGNIILDHAGGTLAAQNEVLSAVVTRAVRKRKQSTARSF
ncbi:hypothetical protein FACS1894208_00880 [Clostridia bacterium]|nr:hypothetical protein FACS1894208_00880 [Clostridia bacterium]